MGLAQLGAGLAWWYRKYDNEQPPLERLEYEMAATKAAVDRIGLWQDRNQMPPQAGRLEPMVRHARDTHRSSGHSCSGREPANCRAGSKSQALPQLIA